MFYFTILVVVLVSSFIGGYVGSWIAKKRTK